MLSTLKQIDVLAIQDRLFDLMILYLVSLLWCFNRHWHFTVTPMHYLYLILIPIGSVKCIDTVNSAASHLKFNFSETRQRVL